MAVQRFGSEFKEQVVLELSTESLCRHNQIIPHLSKQYSFHHCPRNTRHLNILAHNGCTNPILAEEWAAGCVSGCG